MSVEEDGIQQLDLREVLAVLQRKRWLILSIAVLGMVLAGLITLRMPNIYEAKSQIEVKSSTEGGGLLGDLGGGGMDYKETQLALFDNAAVRNLILKNMAASGFTLTPKKLKKKLLVVDRHSTDLIDISARDTNPLLAQALANTTARSFRQYKDGIQNEARQQDLETLKSRVDDARRAMSEAAGALADVQKKYGIIDFPEQTKQDVARVATLTLSREETRRSLEGTEAAIAQLRSQLARQNSMINSVGERDNALIGQLRSQLAEQQATLVNLQQRYVNFPAATVPAENQIIDTEKRLKAELAKVDRGAGDLTMQESLLSQLAGAEQQESTYQSELSVLYNQILAANESFQSLPAQEREYADKTENADVDRELYTKTLESFQQIQMEQLAHPNEIMFTQMADVPNKDDIVSPKPATNLGLGLLLGLVLGLLIAFTLEHLDDAIHSEAELHRLIPDLPVLGILPSHAGAEEPLASAQDPAALGPYRQLWSNLGFTMLDEPLRSLVMTSTVMGEGKSMTLANLAVAAAEEGKQVILVDCDLRRPSLHLKFGLPDGPGLCEVLAGRASLDQVIRDTIHPNLRVVTAGQTLPLNPLVLIKSERFGQVQEDLARSCDVILFDAPPAIGINDALLLASRCQGLVQVVEIGRSTRENLVKVLDATRRARARHIGFILNRVHGPLRKYGYDYYHHGSSNGTNGKFKLPTKLQARSRK